MKSNKQRRAELQQSRRERAAHAPPPERKRPRVDPPGSAPCNPDALAPSGSYGRPPFVARGYYLDAPFTCVGCGKQEVWLATQQKWWYEVAKGNVESRAKRCRACRRAERERQATARQVHLQGVAAKQQYGTGH